jgi:NAD(P)-dependent dehydrogenase (short-subunit alcohol dehydrogenase family)
MGSLEGLSAVVTGGGSGIGKAVVERFVDEGASVVAVDRVEERVKALEAEGGGKVIGIAADVSKHEDNARAVEAAVKAFGKLDVFVGNAGIWDFSASLLDTPPEKLEQAFDELFSVNVKGCLLGAKAAAEELRKTNGSIIFTLSNAAFWPAGGGPIYVSSKHAVHGLVRQLAYELWPEVRVNGVAPGGTMTDLRGLGALGQAETSFGALLKGMQDSGSMEGMRMAEPSDHAGVYVFLAAASESSQVTGTVVDSTSAMLIRFFQRAMPGAASRSQSASS